MNIIKKLSLAIAWVAIAGNTLQAQEQAVQLKGTVVNSPTDYIYLHRFENKIFTVIDSAKVSDGRFSFSTTLPLPDLYGLSSVKDVTPFYIFLDPGTIEVTFDPGNRRATQVNGSDSQQLFTKYRESKTKNIHEFIRDHPDQVVSSYVLYRDWSYRLTPDELEAAIALLSKEQQNSRFTKELKDIIATQRSVAIGKKAPAIAGTDTAGNTVALYDELKEYTLIEFWASWCPPCRKENPNLVANYNKYKDQGFGIYAVSLDKTKEAWLRGIADDGLAWTHVSELRFWDSEIAEAYAVRVIPSNFLVDKEGTIVAKNLKRERLGIVLDSLFNPKKQSAAAGKKRPFRPQNPIRFVPTTTREITLQDKQTFSPDGTVFFSNEFDGARLNSVSKSSDGTYELSIEPENRPINSSSWYSFKVWAKASQEIRIRLNYAEGYRHRYHPTLSSDGINWTKIEQEVEVTRDDRLYRASFTLPVGPESKWIAAQENVSSADVYAWLDRSLDQLSGTKTEIGRTTLGRPIYAYGFGNPESKKRISVLGRQHPPEITAHYGYEAFVDYLLGDTPDAQQFRSEFYIYLLPVLNPDGVDLGHWRHTAGGIDLNRDWHEFNQPESRAARDFFDKELNVNDRQLYFSVDFHSTGSDIYYTVDVDKPSVLPGLVDEWLNTIAAAIPGYDLKQKALYVGGPTYTAYSYLFDTYGAESLVYELGDSTPPAFIKEKSHIAAKNLITLLNKRVP